ncbi:MAG: diacylglycerol/lipid kinase family protein [Phycisphaeraceae bacterium]
MRERLIINPTAGRGDQAEPVQELAARRSGLEVTATEGPGDAARLAREAAEAGVDRLIVAGGDGTVSEVINGAAERLNDVQFLLVPLGTGNDLARTLSLPDEPEAAMALLDVGVERRVDLVRAELGGQVRWYVNAATGGFSERVHEKLTPAVKAAWGPLAYLRAAVEAAPLIEDHQLQLELDGEPLSLRASSVVIANGRFAGGGIELAPEASMHDAAVDVLLVTAKTFLERLRAASDFAAGLLEESEGLVSRRVRRLKIAAEPAMTMVVDGEPIGQTPATFEVVPGAMRMLVPADGEAA